MSSDGDSTEAAGRSGFASGRPAGRPRRSPPQRAKWLLLGAVLVVAVAAIVLLAVRSSSDAEAPAVPSASAGEFVVPSSATSTVGAGTATVASADLDGHAADEAPGSSIAVHDAPLPDAETAWAEIAAEVPMDVARRYSDEELGLYELIDEFLFYRPYYARFRTRDEFFADFSWRNNAIPTEVEGHERERLRFELDLDSLFSAVYRESSADLARLDRAYDEWMAVCAAQAGYPNVELDDESEEELALYASEFDLSPDAFYDLRFDCAQQAATYPTLEPGVRDELVHRVRRHYLRAAHGYFRDFILVEIPVAPLEGAIRPLEESYIQRCLEHEIPDRDSCAEHYRVELTEEQKTAPVPERVPEDESGPYPLVGQPCRFGELPGEVIPGEVFIDRDGRTCDKFENLEFVINNPETIESHDYASSPTYGGPRLLICPNNWVTDDEGKCRYPRPGEAALRDAFVEEHPEFADANNRPLFSDRYRDKD